MEIVPIMAKSVSRETKLVAKCRYIYSLLDSLLVQSNANCGVQIINVLLLGVVRRRQQLFISNDLLLICNYSCVL